MNGNFFNFRCYVQMTTFLGECVMQCLMEVFMKLWYKGSRWSWTTKKIDFQRSLYVGQISQLQDVGKIATFLFAGLFYTLMCTCVQQNHFKISCSSDECKRSLIYVLFSLISHSLINLSVTWIVKHVMQLCETGLITVHERTQGNKESLLYRALLVCKCCD